MSSAGPQAGAQFVGGAVAGAGAISPNLGPPVGVELNTGCTYGGAVVYRQRFAGAALAGADTLLLAAPITGVLSIIGWGTDAGGLLRAFPGGWSDAAFGGGAYVSAVNTLRLFAGTQYIGRPYDLTVEYLR